MRNKSTRFRYSFLTFFVLTIPLSACQSFSSINQNQNSVISPDDALLHDSLLLNRAHPPILLQYGERTCTYVISKSNKMLNPSLDEARSIVIVPFHDKYTFLSSNGEHKSSVVIDRYGKVYDFNEWSIYNPTERIVTPETASAVSRAQLKMAHDVMNPLTEANPHLVDEMSYEFPFFEQAVGIVGQIVAHVYTFDDHTMWASYRFIGFSTFRGREVAIIDLERKEPDLDNKAIVVGFNVIDVATAMPLLAVFKSGTETHLRQISCDK